MNLTASASLQARSIFALIMRRVRSQYAGSRAGYAWAIVEPIVWVFVLKMALRGGGTTGIPPLGTSYEVFFASGIVLARGWRSSVGQISAVLTRNRKERIPTLHRMDSVLATWILETITSGVALVVILAILGIFGFDAMPDNMLVCVIALAVCSIYILASALMLALILTLAPGLSHFKGIFLLIGFMTSGFSFVVDRVPAGIRNVVTWNPLLHVIEFFREGFYKGYECISLDLTYLAGVTVVMILLGFVGERAFRRHEYGQTSGAMEDDMAL